VLGPLATLLLVSQHASRAEADQPVSEVEAESIIFERQQLMTRLDDNVEALGNIAAGVIPPSKLAETARAIAQDAMDARAAFEPKVPGGRSKPEVWTNWPDFSQRLQRFVDNSEKMAQVADTGNLSAVVEMMVTALPCKQCHDVYREKKRQDKP
jgi:cytochrome c556